MNKKRLSVVMAGAMLASSVAPVLAAEVVKSETSAAELGLLIQKVRDQYLETKKFANETIEDRSINGTYAGKSVYYLVIDGRKYDYSQLDSQADLQNAIGSLKAGSKVEVWSYGFVTEGEGENVKYYAREAGKEDKYTAEDFYTTGSSNTNGTTIAIQNRLNRIKDIAGKVTVTVETVGDKRQIKIALNGKTFANGESTFIIKDNNTTKYDFNYFIDKTTKKSTKVEDASTLAEDIESFAKVSAIYTDVAEKNKEMVEEITITSGGHELAIEDLYDGLMLTTKGHDFFTMLKEADAMGRGYSVNGNAGSINGTSVSNRENNKGLVAGAIQKDKKGNYVFTVTLPKFYLDGNQNNGADADDDKKFIPAETYTIVSKDEKNAERLATWMLKPLARVDILAGSNRYETAVKIAEEYAGLTTVGVRHETTPSTTANANIVLVNGDALVDGLAAAPLAATKVNNINGKDVSAPILLTEADELPKETKAYLKRILKNVEIGSLKKVTIHLVGGESVLNKSLERELFHLGFKVERYGGDNREETSLEVAKEVEKTNTTNERFVVGADGEADAMSIAAVAAYNKTPIIVAKRGGISEDALHTFDEKANVAIVGGETVVTEAEENGLKSVSKAVIRLGGENRKATNAKIIETYYKRSALDSNSGFVGEAVGNGRTNHVIVAKDGQRKKTELVDALAAANFASEIKAPIVLATDKLSKEQISALELNSKTSTALYQVGIGVARDVVKTIAEGLNLTNSNRY